MSDLNKADQNTPESITPMDHLRAFLTPDDITCLFFSLGAAAAVMRHRNQDYSAGRVLELINKLKTGYQPQADVVLSRHVGSGLREGLGVELVNVGPNRFALCRHDVIATECEQCEPGLCGAAHPQELDVFCRERAGHTGDHVRRLKATLCDGRDDSGEWRWPQEQPMIFRGPEVVKGEVERDEPTMPEAE